MEELHRRNSKVCIATATDRYQVEVALQRCGMCHFFSEIFTCTEVGSAKDHPEIFRTAMEHLQAERNNTIVIEDAYHAVQTAKSDGFMVAGVYDSQGNRQKEILKLADIYLPDYLDLTHFWKFASAE